MTAGYFAYLGVLALFLRVPYRRKVLVWLASLAGVASVLVVGMPHVMPMVYLLGGYWLPAWLVSAPNRGLERRLLQFDRDLFGVNGLTRFEQRAPRALVEYLELAYLCCYAVVPGGYAWLMLAGYGAEAGRFWSIVLLAAFICYGMLPLLPTRAPRALEGDVAFRRSAVRRVNLAVLGRASVQWNTFPSGHTAASIATALAVGAHVPAAGVVLGAIGVSIAVGSVTGRYHYAADAILGFLVAVLAFAMATGAFAP